MQQEATPAVALEGIEALRKDEPAGRIARDALQGTVERSSVGCPGRAFWERLVVGKALSCARAALLSEAGVRRVGPFGLAMEATIEYVVAVVEDRLRAVAVVNIEIQNGDALGAGRCLPARLCRRPGGALRARGASASSFQKIAGGERGVVEVAIDAHGSPGRVMPRRPAERVGHRLAGE